MTKVVKAALIVVAVVAASIAGYLILNNYLTGRGPDPYLGKVSRYVNNFKKIHLVFNSVCGGIRDEGYVELVKDGSEVLSIKGAEVKTGKYLLTLFVNDSVRGVKNGTFTFWISCNGTIYRFHDPIRGRTFEWPQTGAAKLLLLNALPMMAIDSYLDIEAGENGVYIPSSKGIIVNSSKSTYVVNGVDVPSWTLLVKPPPDVKGDVKLLKLVVGKVYGDWYILSVTLYGKKLGCFGVYSITEMVKEGSGT